MKGYHINIPWSQDGGGIPRMSPTSRTAWPAARHRKKPYAKSAGQDAVARSRDDRLQADPQAEMPAGELLLRSLREATSGARFRVPPAGRADWSQGSPLSGSR